MTPGAGPGGLRAMMLADMPDPGLARVAEETGRGIYRDSRGPGFVRRIRRPLPTSCTRNIFLGSPLPYVTARCMVLAFA